MVAYTVVYISGFELAVRELRFADGMSFCGSLQAVFVKFTNQNFPVGIFVFLKVFVYTSTIRLYLTPKCVKLYTIFFHLNSILPLNPEWVAYSTPTYLLVLWTTYYIFEDQFRKDNSILVISMQNYDQLICAKNMATQGHVHCTYSLSMIKL